MNGSEMMDHGASNMQSWSQTVCFEYSDASVAPAGVYPAFLIYNCVWRVGELNHGDECRA